MRKILLYVLGGILVFLGVFCFICTFMDLGEPMDPSARTIAILIAVAGVAVIVLNRIIKSAAQNVLAGVHRHVSVTDRISINRYKNGKCPYCGKTLVYKGTNENGAERYDCPDNDLAYSVKRKGSYTVATDQNGEQTLIAHDVFPYKWWYKRHRDDEGDMIGTISDFDSNSLERVFRLLEEETRMTYDKDSPEFKQAEEDAQKLDNGLCPICGGKIHDKRVFVPAYEGLPSTEFTPAFIPSLGGSVFIKHEVLKGASPAHYVTVTSCELDCHKQACNFERIARALALRKKPNTTLDQVYENAGYRFISPKEELKTDNKQ